jgi:hypothetical protein
MDGYAYQAARGFRLDPPGHQFGVSCDQDGPSVGPVRLLQKTQFGTFEPRPAAELNFVLGKGANYPIDFAEKMGGLKAVANALNEADLARAMFATQFMQLPVLTSEAASRKAAQADTLFKASADDEEHPGWPGGTPGSRGGQFRPKTETATSATPNLPAVIPAPKLPAVVPTAKPLTHSDIDKVAARLAVRRQIRMGLMASLTQQNQLLQELFPMPNHLENFEPKTHFLKDTLLLDNVAQIMVEVKELKTAMEAAHKFINAAPYTLDELRVATAYREFSSPDAFRKADGSDEIDFEKFFGSAGDGYQYHHIVEWRINEGSMRAGDLHNSVNMVRIPTLIHEAISAHYSGESEVKGVTVRALLKTKSYNEQRAYGLKILRDYGILK